jgi:hypothetical protein
MGASSSLSPGSQQFSIHRRAFTSPRSIDATPQPQNDCYCLYAKPFATIVTHRLANLILPRSLGHCLNRQLVAPLRRVLTSGLFVACDQKGQHVSRLLLFLARVLHRMRAGGVANLGGQS